MCWLCACVCARALACVCACVCVWARLRNYLIFNENKEECWNAECYCLPLNLCINNFNIGLPVALFVLINNSCISSNCGFESRKWHGCFFVVSVVCYQVKVSTTTWSLVLRSPTDCGASFVRVCDLETWRMGWPWLALVLSAMERWGWRHLQTHTLTEDTDADSVYEILIAFP